MIDAKTGSDSHRRRRRRSPATAWTVGDGGPATSAHLNMPSDVAIDRRTATSTSPTCTTTGSARSTRKTHIITTVAGSGVWGYSGDDGPATAGAAGRAGRRRGGPRAGRQGDDLHRRLLQRARPRRRARRHHPRPRATKGARRSARRRAWRSPRRTAARLALRRRFEPGPDRAADHPADRAEPRAGAAVPPARRQTGGRMSAAERLAARSSAGRCRSCVRTADAWRSSPCCCSLEIGARRAAAVAAGGRHRLRARRAADSAAVRRLAAGDPRRRSASRCSSSSCVAGVVLQIGEPGRVGLQHAGAGRYRPADGLRPALPAVPASDRRSACTITSPPARRDAVYRVDVDAYAIENLVMSGIFPLATSIIVADGDVRRSCCGSNVTIALLSLAVVPFLYLCLRYYMSTLVQPRGAREGARVEAARAAVRDVRRDAAGQELRARAARAASATPRAGDTTMNARIAHHLAAVAVLGRRQHDHDPRHGAGA